MLFYASGIAFNGILCLIPFLLLLTSLLGVVLSSSDLALRHVNDVLNATFPREAYTQEIKHSIQRAIDDIIRHKSSYGIIGLGILTWTATSLFSAIRSVVNRVYKITTRKLVIVKVIEEILLVLVLGMLFFLANVFIWTSTIVRTYISNIPLLNAIPAVFFRGANSFAAAYIPGCIMFFLISRVIPDTKITSKSALVAALVTTVLWWIAGRAFVWYLSEFHSYSMLYGAYAFLAVFILWIYYSSVAFIVGIVIAQLYRERS
jgi:membrane protein